MKVLNLKSILKRKMLRACTNIFVVMFMVTATMSPVIFAQTFNSTSDGSDGALDYSDAAPGWILFNPDNLDPPLDPDNDNVYHFTSITIPQGVKVWLGSNTRMGSRGVFWFVSGAVNIEGELWLNGWDGHTNSPDDDPFKHVAGAGGFSGGVGARSEIPAQPGRGPGGAQVGGGSAEHAKAGPGTLGGAAYGNEFLIPLIGGSGGGGAGGGGGGGSGSGAILIASSESITVNGLINADGGFGGSGAGSGSGGGIRLISPVINVPSAGKLSATGRNSVSGQSSNGRIRLEAFDRNIDGATISPAPLLAIPGVPFLPDKFPTVRVTTVGGVPVPDDPSASKVDVDVVINSDLPVTLEIEAHFIPPGTVVNLAIYPENSSFQTVDSTPLEGTFEESSATASVQVPFGTSRFTVEASWGQ